MANNAEAAYIERDAAHLIHPLHNPAGAQRWQGMGRRRGCLPYRRQRRPLH